MPGTSGANTVKTTRTFSFAALPAGSIINSAYISCSRRGSNSGSLRTVDGNNDSVNSTANITIAASRITAGGTLAIEFAYRATAYTYSTAGYYNGSTWWENIVLTVDYTGYTACTAPTTVSINNATATPSQTRTLSWSGAKAGLNVAISKYEIYRSTSAGGPYTKLGETTGTSYTVTAPASAGSYYYKIKTIGSVTGYSSGLSTASASVSVSVTAPAAPTGLSMSPSSQYPTGTATLSWNQSSGGTNNPATGYKVYSCATQGGTYTLLATISGAANHTYSITTQASGTRYFKVMVVGTYLDSALSAAVSLSVDMSGTSDFTCSPDPVDAGTALTVSFTTNIGKAHTVVFSIGSYSQTVQSAADAGSVSFTPPLAWLNALPDSVTAPMTVKVTTSGAGTLTKTVSLRCPDNVVPTGVNGSVVPYSSAVPAAWGVYAARLSAATVTISTAAAAPYGASIVRYRITGSGIYMEGGALPLSATSNLLSQGSYTFTLYAIDSRGRVGTRQLSVTVLPYSAPTLQNVLSRRTDSQGEEEDEGTWALAQADIIYSPLGGHNTASCAVAYRKQGVSAWSSAGNLSNGEKLFGSGSITPADNWEIRYTVTDGLGNSAVYYDIVTRAVWEFHVKKGGGAWAFGGVANQMGALKVYGQVAASLGNVPTAVCDINGNLNNATAPGVYSYESNYSNVPSNAGGCLLVFRPFNWDIISQIAFANNASKNAVIWARQYYSDGWGSWVCACPVIQTWTPKLYDSDTYVRDLGTVSYIQQGKLVIAWIIGTFDFSGISTMLQIRNIPMDVIVGGTAYIDDLNKSSFDHPLAIQGGTSRIYIRPNIKSSMLPNPSSTANVSIMVVGYKS